MGKAGLVFVSRVSCPAEHRGERWVEEEAGGARRCLKKLISSFMVCETSFKVGFSDTTVDGKTHE